MSIDHVSGVPLYIQLSDLLRGQIESGEIPPKSMLPSLRVLCQEHEIARMTAERAITVLRMEGLVRGVPGKGVYVVPVAERPKQPKR